MAAAGLECGALRCRLAGSARARRLGAAAAAPIICVSSNLASIFQAGAAPQLVIGLVHTRCTHEAADIPMVHANSL
jgi:hypothetical protein